MYKEYFYFRKTSCFVFKTFKFLGIWCIQTSKFVMSLKILLHVRSYTCDCYLRIFGSIKMKFGHMFSVTYGTRFQFVFSAFVKTGN